MKDISDAIDLMTTARDVLMRDLLPTLPKDKRYTGLMVANAMAIALREQMSAPAAVRDEAARLRKLLREDDAMPRLAPDAETQSDVSALRRAMSGAIRAGRFDDHQHQSALIAHLARTAADWVAISNPKALRASSTSAPT
jgi:hypothetical protein